MLNEVPYKYTRKFLLMPRTCTSTRTSFFSLLALCPIKISRAKKIKKLNFNFKF